VNCFLHGIEDFQIVRGDTLADPKFVEGDRLKRFDLVLANPPYSIKQWDRDSFASDAWGRNLFGTPPQGRADYAFWQHIICSLAPKTGRCAILFPHGVLFRQEESEMRQKLIEADLIECVLGLGPNLFYNSPMEACVVICRNNKPKDRKGKILFVNAINEVTRERAQSFLTNDHIERITATYRAFADETGFAKIATLADVRSRKHSLSIPLYVELAAGNRRSKHGDETSIPDALASYLKSCESLAAALATEVHGLKLPEPTGDLKSCVSAPLLTNRKRWKRVCFGDVVESANETVSDPGTAGIERFIGLEHLEPGSLHVRTWGDVAGGTTFTRRCRPGQVLFGKRRAYQRKVAVAEFNAVVSGDIYVLSAQPDRLIPELLPFICLSQSFFEHAVGTSAGSLSPRTNWNSLATFELDLPPMDQQKSVAAILWAIDAAHVQLSSLRTASEAVRDTFFDEQLRLGTQSNPDSLKTLGSVISRIVAGKSPRAASSPAGKGQKGVLKVSAVGDGEFQPNENKAILSAGDFCSDFEVRPGMILVTRCNAQVSGVGRACRVVESPKGLMLSDKTLQLVPNLRLIDPEFLLHGLRRNPYRSFVEGAANGTEAKNISQEQLRAAPFWVPELSRQQEITAQLRTWAQLIEATQMVIRSLEHLATVVCSGLIQG
jgi:restriction endonuclease S subunit